MKQIPPTQGKEVSLGYDRLHPCVAQPSVKSILLFGYEVHIYYIPAHYMPVIQVLSSSNMEKRCFAYNSGLFTLVSAQQSQSWQPRFTKESAPGHARIQHLVRDMCYPGFLKD